CPIRKPHKPLNPVVQTIKKNCPDWIGITVRNESESVSGMDRNHCPKIIGMGVRNGSEYAGMAYFSLAFVPALTGHGVSLTSET
ncbi:MAG: hypothetical protein KJ935_07270, partial [Candidatus Omnitrophica bacterium]|nr:hypothetical protein [Candidatus Omnitrophota bacterium]